jgi:hypothetical protein
VLEETTDGEQRAAGELGSMFIRVGHAILDQGLPFVDALYAMLCRTAGKGTIDALLCAMQEHNIPAWPGIGDDSFEFCVNCAVAMTGGVPDKPHASDCPAVTDLWPVTSSEIKDQMCCGGCKKPFEFGDCYVTLPRIGCLGCAAQGNLA